MAARAQYVSDPQNVIKATQGALQTLRTKLEGKPGRGARLAIAGFG